MGQYYRGVVLEQPINETNEIKVKEAFVVMLLITEQN